MAIAQAIFDLSGADSIITLIVLLLLHALILKIALGLVVEGRVTFSQALGAIVAAWLVSWLVSLLLSALLPANDLSYLILAVVNVLVTLGVIANVVQTTMLRAFAGVLLAALLEMVLVWLAHRLVAGAQEAEEEVEAMVRAVRLYI
jgi:hypothetical protein